MNRRLVVEALFAGVSISLLAGLIPNTPPELMGAVWYGYPLPWLFEMVVAPQYYPWSFIFVNLLIDVAIWSITFFLLRLLLIRVRAKS